MYSVSDEDVTSSRSTSRFDFDIKIIIRLLGWSCGWRAPLLEAPNLLGELRTKAQRLFLGRTSRLRILNSLHVYKSRQSDNTHHMLH